MDRPRGRLRARRNGNMVGIDRVTSIGRRGGGGLRIMHCIVASVVSDQRTMSLGVMLCVGVTSLLQIGWGGVTSHYVLHRRGNVR